jgi:hypothetical protein
VGIPEMKKCGLKYVIHTQLEWSIKKAEPKLRRVVWKMKIGLRTEMDRESIESLTCRGIESNHV